MRIIQFLASDIEGGIFNEFDTKLRPLRVPISEDEREAGPLEQEES